MSDDLTAAKRRWKALKADAAASPADVSAAKKRYKALKNNKRPAGDGAADQPARKLARTAAGTASTASAASSAADGAANGAANGDLRAQCEASLFKVFVSGLSPDATDVAICDFFETVHRCGVVDDTYWLMDRKTGAFRGSGFMTFETVDGAVAACGLSGTAPTGASASLTPAADGGAAVTVVPARPMKSWKGQMHSGKTTRVFCKNMNYEITEEQLRGFFAEVAPRAQIKEIQWMEDEEKKFNGTAIVTFTSAGGASQAIKHGHGAPLLGRDMTCKPATARMAAIGAHDGGEGGGGGGGGAVSKKKAVKELSERPEGGTTVCFVGNLPFDVTDEQMTEFAGGEEYVKYIRWLSFEDTGKFKGCGFVEFHDCESVDLFVKKNGTDFGGRNIQIDYSMKRPEK